MYGSHPSPKPLDRGEGSRTAVMRESCFHIKLLVISPGGLGGLLGHHLGEWVSR